ncbi:MAG: rhomboid family intramembrane serine protease [Clostridia bacterium]|nr:rhomboid family intramembrane serine protease [Clostridia bacterium]
MWRNRKIPYATLVILFLNVACYLAEAIMGEEKASLTFAMYAHALSVSPVAWYRVLASSFMHFGFLHLICNMLALLSIGVEMEEIIGWKRYLIIYAAAILGDGLMVNFAGGEGLHMGASGALWGLMAALLIVVLRLHGNPNAILRCLVLNLAVTFGFSGISWQGHIGGGIAGLIAALIMLAVRPRRRMPVQAVRPPLPAESDDSDMEP